MSECRTGSHVASVAVVTAIGCDEDGWRRVLGLDVVDTESYDSWLGFLQGLRARGVHGVELVTSTPTRVSSAPSRRSSRAPRGRGAWST